eukprot:4873777-Pleurochrysis_carterae.AAC.3
MAVSRTYAPKRRLYKIWSKSTPQRRIQSLAIRSAREDGGGGGLVCREATSKSHPDKKRKQNQGGDEEGTGCGGQRGTENGIVCKIEEIEERRQPWAAVRRAG